MILTLSAFLKHLIGIYFKFQGMVKNKFLYFYSA